jgi:hypothetical protein
LAMPKITTFLPVMKPIVSPRCCSVRAESREP